MSIGFTDTAKTRRISRAHRVDKTDKLRVQQVGRVTKVLAARFLN